MDTMETIEPTEPHKFNHLRRVDRAIQEMLGVVRGILCDGQISDQEARGLNSWILQNPDIHKIFPVFQIAERLQRIFADGIVDDVERAELTELLTKVTGGDLGRATALPVDNPFPVLDFSDRRYIFTGKFVYGSRKACEEAVIARGAIIAPTVSAKVDFLVIGEIGSADWKFSAWGTKIHDAMRLKQEKKKIAIISEEHWIAHLK